MPHRIRATDTDEHVIEDRAEVRSKWGKIDKFLERYGRFLIAIVVAVSTWFLSHVVAPLNQIPGVVAHQRWQDSVESARSTKSDSLFHIIDTKLDSGVDDRSRMIDILGALAGLQCDTFTAREQRTSKLCGKLLRGELP